MFVKSSEKEVLGVKYKHDLRCFEPRLFGAMTSLTFASGVFLYWNCCGSLRNSFSIGKEGMPWLRF